MKAYYALRYMSANDKTRLGGLYDSPEAVVSRIWFEEGWKDQGDGFWYVNDPYDNDKVEAVYLIETKNVNWPKTYPDEYRVVTRIDACKVGTNEHVIYYVCEEETFHAGENMFWGMND